VSANSVLGQESQVAPAEQVLQTGMQVRQEGLDKYLPAGHPVQVVAELHEVQVGGQFEHVDPLKYWFERQPQVVTDPRVVAVRVGLHPLHEAFSTPETDTVAHPEQPSGQVTQFPPMEVYPPLQVAQLAEDFPYYMRQPLQLGMTGHKLQEFVNQG
jgi:hypothetical protein